MAKKKCELCDGVAAASPRRSIATTTARPVGFHCAANPASSSSVIHRCFSSESAETIAKKKVEDVMPTATGHEKEELEAELEVIPCVFFLCDGSIAMYLLGEGGFRKALAKCALCMFLCVGTRKVILESAILTTVVVLSLTVYTFWAAKRGYDFNFLGPFLFGALIVLIVFAMIQVTPLIPNSMP
ncbi:BnaA01g22850D [Brassica napus]|uniref:BnaA01g22850D protein n=1 Tax=Brassica napus TaxID=3708 RepID=A0A078II46_BRANA|nr:BnaA01g22850D [Brassica napus]